MTATNRSQVVGRNMAALTGAQVVSRVLAGLTTVYLARVLTPEYFGIIEVAVTVLTYAELLVDAGLRRLGSREVVRGDIAIPQLAKAMLTLRLLLAVGSFAIMLLAIGLWPGPLQTKWILSIYALTLFVVAFDFSWLFLGLERMHYIALADIATQVIVIGGVLLLVRSPAQLVLVPVIYLLARAAGIALLIWRYGRNFGRPVLGLEREVAYPLFRAALPLGVVGFLSLTTYNFDILLIGLLAGAHAAGIYGAAYRLVALPAVLATSYFSSLLPSLDRTYKEGGQTLRSLLDKSVRLTAVVGVGLGVGGSMLARPGFELLYGAQYLDSVLPFQILIWSVTLLFINRNFRVLLVSFGHQRYQLLVVASAAGLNVGLNLLLIPLYGLAGAAVATVLSELLTLFLSYFFTRRLIEHLPLWRHLLRVAPAGLLLAATLYWSANQHLLVRIALGGLVYGLAVLALRMITLEEVRLVLQAWRPARKRPHPAGNQP